MEHEQIRVKKGIHASQHPHVKSGPVLLNTNIHQSLLMQHYRNIGNQAVQRMVESGVIQAKLKIGQPNDKYEQEADRVADQVMRMPEPKGALVNGYSSLMQRESGCPECPEKEEIQTKPLADQITPFVQRQVGPDEVEEVQTRLQRQVEEEEEPLQAKQANNQMPAVTPTIESGIQSLKGGGQPLTESTRSYFEPRFGTDFSHVRVHTDSKAAETAKSMNAKAFTVGKDLVFGSEQFLPKTVTGKRLLAHELTHVLQQRSYTFPASTGMEIRLQPIACDSRRITGVQDQRRNPVQEVREAHDLALEYAQLSLTQVGHVRSGSSVPLFIEWAMERNFDSPNANALRIIRNRYRAIVRWLNRGADRLYRCTRGGGCRDDDVFAEVYCPARGSRASLCPRFFQVGAVVRALTLVHEAAHAVGACIDVRSTANNYPGSAPFNNAWSYEGFTRMVAVTMGTIPFRQRRSVVPQPSTSGQSP